MTCKATYAYSLPIQRRDEMQALATQPEIVSMVDLILNSRLTKGEKINRLLCIVHMDAVKAIELVNRPLHVATQ